VRSFPARDSVAPLALVNLNGSGTLMPIALFNELGGFEEEFFIDHVDTEWAFRVLAAGYGLYGIPDVVFGHRMGERSLRFWWLGWRVWPYRSPTRHFYLFRNATRLLSRDYVPQVWKFWAVVKLGLTLLVHALFDPRRMDQIHSMLTGVRDARSAARAQEHRRE
jgi:rhamnosyltransferase